MQELTMLFWMWMTILLLAVDTIGILVILYFMNEKLDKVSKYIDSIDEAYKKGDESGGHGFK